MRALFTIVASMTLTACATTTPAPMTSVAPTGTASTVERTNDAEQPVPDIWRFTAQRVGGGSVNGETFAGKKVAVWLWAPWCGPCNRLAPTVAGVSLEYPAITFLGVPGQDSDEAHEVFVEEYDLDHIVHAIDERRQLWGHFGSNTQEAWLFVDEDGSVGRRTRYGEMQPDLLRSYLDELVAA